MEYSDRLRWEVKTMTASRCPNCGARASALDPPGAGIAFDDLHVPALARFIEGALDSAKCDAGCPVEAAPTIAVLVHEPDVLWVAFGDRLPPSQHGAMVNAFLREVSSSDNNCEVETFQTISDLRRALVDHMIANVRALEQLLSALGSSQFGQLITKHWREVTPSRVAALRVAATGVVPGLRLGIQSTSQQQLADNAELDLLARIQWMSWAGLCMSWFTDKNHSDSLEADLNRWLDRSPVIEGADIAFFDWCTQVMTKDLTFDSAYAVQAARASLCAQQGISNLDARVWGAFYMAYESADSQSYSPKRQKMRISEARARATVTELAVVDAVERQISSSDALPDSIEQINRLEAAGSRAGHSGLVSQLVTGQLRIQVPEEELLQVLLEMLAEGGEESIRVMESLARPLILNRRRDDLLCLGETMIRTADTNYDLRADIEAWLGRSLKELREPEAFLDLVGMEPREWESEIAAERQASLLVERSNALRMLGSRTHALDAIQQAARILAAADVESMPVQINLGILLRECGYLDSSVQVLEHALEKAQYEERVSALESLGQSLMALGRNVEAREKFNAAMQVASELRSPRHSVLASFSGTFRTDEDTGNDTDASYTQEQPLSVDPALVLAEADAWINRLWNTNEAVPDELADHLTAIYRALRTIADEAEARGDAQTMLAARRAFAWMAEWREDEWAEHAWTEVVEASLSREIPPDPAALLFLASKSYSRGERESARHFLNAVPVSLAEVIGGIADMESAVNSASSAAKILNDVTRVVLFDQNSGADMADVRLAAELGRDMVGRSRAWRRYNRSVHELGLSAALSDDGLATLAPAKGSLGVLETVDDGEYWAFLLTTIDSAGSVQSKWLEQPEHNIDFRRLGRQMTNRLQNWTRRRPGDPFEIREWDDFERWLIHQLGVRLKAGDHLVVIPDAETILPWHVATAGRYTLSYAPGWTRLFEVTTAESWQPQSMGIVTVPRFGDPDRIVSSLTVLSEGARRLAAEYGMTVLAPSPTECDREVFLRLLEATDIAVLLCHGFVDPVDNGIALMLASDGTLPLGDAHALGSEAGRDHRVSWRDCQGLTHAPRVVFSGACSSGLSRVAGTREQLGLFAGLRHAGNYSLVAPRWPVEALEVMPIIQRALSLFLRGEGLARAVQTASLEAVAGGMPRWLSCSLSVEGGW